MFGKPEPAPPVSSQEPTPDPKPEPAAQLPDRPIAYQDREARRKRWPPIDRNTPRLMSFGVRKVYRQGRDGRQGPPIELEGACDVVNTSRTFWRYAGDENAPWHENDVSDKPNTKVIDTGIWVRRHDPRRHADEGDKTNKVTTFPPLTEAERAAAAVMRGIVGRD